MFAVPSKVGGGSRSPQPSTTTAKTPSRKKYSYGVAAGGRGVRPALSPTPWGGRHTQCALACRLAEDVTESVPAPPPVLVIAPHVPREPTSGTDAYRAPAAAWVMVCSAMKA